MNNWFHCNVHKDKTPNQTSQRCNIIALLSVRAVFVFKTLEWVLGIYKERIISLIHFSCDDRHFFSPESKFISTQFTPPLERRSDIKSSELLRILVLCLLCFSLKPLEDTYLDKNNDIYQISVVQVGLLLYLQSYLSIVLTVVKLLWYLRCK